MSSPVLSLHRNRAIYFFLRSTICISGKKKLSFFLYLKYINKQAQMGPIFSTTEDSRNRL